jgi:hypothetical protein
MSVDQMTGRRLAHADPRALEYLQLRWAECWPTLSAFDSYPPAAWSGAIRRWVAHELDRIEALLVRVDALLCERQREAS